MIFKVLTLKSDDTNDLQTLTVKGIAGETLENIERLQDYGFTGNPPDDSEAVLISIGGNKDNCIIVVCDNGDERPGLDKGETCFYSKFGQIIKHKKDGNTEITADKVLLNGSDNYAVKYNELKDAFDKLRDDFNALVLAYNTHSGHTEGATPTSVLFSTASVDASRNDKVRM